MVSHWMLSNSKSLQVSRTLLSILSDINNAVVWMVSTCPLISKSSSPCTNPLVTVPRAPITIGIIVTLMFHSLFFFQFLRKVQVLIFFFVFFQFYRGLLGRQSLQLGKFFLFCWFSLDKVVWPRLGELFISQNLRELFASHFPWQIQDCAYTISS